MEQVLTDSTLHKKVIALIENVIEVGVAIRIRPIGYRGADSQGGEITTAIIDLLADMTGDRHTVLIYAHLRNKSI